VLTKKRVREAIEEKKLMDEENKRLEQILQEEEAKELINFSPKLSLMH